MGHRHSRTKAPRKDVPVAAAVRSGAEILHIGRTQRDTSIQPHRRRIREPKLLSELPSEYARCTDVGRDLSPIEPQTKPELVPPPIDPPQYKLDSLGPLESFNGPIRNSSSSERGEETLTTPQVLIQDPSSARHPDTADVLEQSHAPIAPREPTEEDPATAQVQSPDSSSARRLDIADFLEQSHAPITPSHVLVGSPGSSTGATSNNAPPVPTLSTKVPVRPIVLFRGRVVDNIASSADVTHDRPRMTGKLAIADRSDEQDCQEQNYSNTASKTLFTFGLTDHESENPTGRLFPLSAPSGQPSHETTTGPLGEDLVALQGTPKDLHPVKGDGLVTQAALDYAMAVSLQEEEDCRYAAELQAPSRDCTVCCEALHPLEFPAMPPSSDCTHAADVCFPCLQQWVATKVDANARAVIDCPRCTAILRHEDVRRACNFETFAKYDRFAALTVVNGLQNFHWCLRPGCTAGQEHIGGHLGYMQCYACDFEQCLKHKTAWHRGQTCRQYDARIGTQADKQLREQEERATTKFMDEQQIKIRLRECPDSRCRNRIPEGEEIPEKCPKRGCKASLEREPVWKRCPACHTLIEKTYGCDQMKCTMTRCKQKFCWQCLATWEDMLRYKGKAHGVGCKYRTGTTYPYSYR